MSREPRPGFTLIEVLVVVVVIAMLAALVAPNVFNQLGTARDAAARSQIEMLAAALDAYRLDMRTYPTTEEGLAALRIAPERDPAGSWRGPYLRKDVPHDPWGNAYHYGFPSPLISGSFDLRSHGADGVPGGSGTDADIVYGN